MADHRVAAAHLDLPAAPGAPYRIRLRRPVVQQIVSDRRSISNNQSGDITFCDHKRSTVKSVRHVKRVRLPQLRVAVAA